jgi:hypothetical protein
MIPTIKNSTLRDSNNKLLRRGAKRINEASWLFRYLVLKLIHSLSRVEGEHRAYWQANRSSRHRTELSQWCKKLLSINWRPGQEDVISISTMSSACARIVIDLPSHITSNTRSRHLHQKLTNISRKNRGDKNTTLSKHHHTRRLRTRVPRLWKDTISL